AAGREEAARAARRRRLLAHVGLVLGAAIMLYPLLWMVASSFKPETEIFAAPDLWPDTVDWHNYARGWNGLANPFRIFFENSIVIAIGAVIGNVVSCSLAAYAFACLDFPLRRFWFAVMLMTIMLPHHVTLIPQYILFHQVGWVNTFLPLIVPHFFAVAAFFIFLMVQFIRGIPAELLDSARVDGCGPVRIYRHIVLPLLTPALVTTTIFTFIWTYNDFFSQLIYLNDMELYTVPVALRTYLDATGESSWGPMFAMSTLALAPVFAVFLGFQRLIVQGIATTGLKS
ncbi:MAG: carbohydrate ABC transporter permease, partial [Micromonosporaceae bacterium]